MEKGTIMGEKAKGRDSNKAKKPKTPKVGHRPHEERQRQAALTTGAPSPAQGRPAERG
jgi:hypothetical protein